MTTIVAVDWSGKKKDDGRTVWMAAVEEGRMTRLENGRSRKELTEELVALERRSERLILGIDFAFSFPAPYMRQQGWGSAREGWRAATHHGEGWLRGDDPRFWGRVKKTTLDGHEEYRHTEKVLRERGTHPKSIFQTGGVGAVGTGAIRGMPLLVDLADAGFAVWPFDDPADRSVVVEIYPRLLTGNVKKTVVSECISHLERYSEEMRERHIGMAAATEDSFDAAVSAVQMWRHRDQLEGLRQAHEPGVLLEGMIWNPVLTARGPDRTHLDDVPTGGLDSHHPCRDCGGVSLVSADGLGRRCPNCEHIWTIGREGSS
ncbi:MAG TPA: hypothetical protein VIK61_14720 [Acidimicrobiia bacterium]